ncbi:4-hydroxy-tetrahydrodipicolinate reductase [Acetobacter conturbans]|uniref:4-hydroxy-tetrahydrodipicolinate reductase n=1 Tax=Acetobacter conturbans TaxID=1737472 RepID=A0ABX0JZW3_9PROT|nr:4-hydroxy-tetrahydrodipicolinate reductase [Acetobacter conturbans]NHN88901.1 4-hydroxy-tetrahydrodipicolinate reductase [Acetobacter conturbans]
MSSHSLRVGIAGLSGRMGQMLVRSVLDAGCRVTGGICRDPGENGLSMNELTREGAITLCADMTQLATMSDVVIDFTHVSTVIPHAEALKDTGTPWILGTTGLSETDQKAVAVAAQSIPVVQAANFSAGVTLVLRLAREMGAALSAERFDAEIVEMHHRQKVDAPSGTALAIGEAVAKGRDVTFADVRTPAREGQCGARKTGEIGFAALRGGQIVGEHTVLFTSATEQIALSHRAFDRRVFADGAVQAAEWSAGKTAGLYNMEDVLGLT